MNKRTLIFNEINGLDAFDFYIDSVQKSTPSKKQHIQSLPYCNKTYDFDLMIGYPTYEERQLVYTGQVIAADSTELDDIISAIKAWLLTPVQAELQDTATPKYHYLARCTSVVPAEQGEYAELTITFLAHPLKIMNQSINDIKWDTFNFETDYMPTTEFSVTAGTAIIIDNMGAGPVDLESSIDGGTGQALTVRVDGETHTLSNGKAGFKLLPGKNEIQIITVPQQTAKIEFDWVEERI